MKCLYCNSEIPEGSRFCPACGAKLEAVGEVSAAAVQSAEDILAGIKAKAPAQKPQEPEPVPPVQEPVPPVQEPVPPEAAYTPPEPAYIPPEPVYAPPAQDYAQPAPSYTQQPAQDYAQPAQSYTQPAAPLKAQKKSKKGLLIGLCAGLALVLAAVLLYFLVFAGSPVTRALNGNLRDGSALLHAGNLGKAVSNLESIGKSGKFDASLSAQSAGDMAVNGQLALGVDAKATAYGGTLDFALGEAGGSIRYAGDKTDLQAAVDGMEGVYGVSYADALEQFGLDRDALNDLYFATDSVTLASLKKGPLKPFFDSIKTEEVGQTMISTEGGDKVCKHYTLTWDRETIEALLEKNEDLDSSGIVRLVASSSNTELASYGLASVLNDLKPTAELYIAGGKLLGVDVTDTSGTVSYVRFLGAKNVWEHVRLTDSSQSTRVDLYWQKAGTLRLCVEEDGQEAEIFRYDDANGAFSIGLDDEAIRGTISAQGKGAAVTADVAGEAASATLSVQPMSGKLSMLDSSYTDVLSMSAEQQEKLLGDLNSALKLDKIGDLFSGLDALSGLSGDDEDPGEVTLFPGMDVDLGDDDLGDDDTEISLPTPSGDVTESDLAGTFYLDHLAAGDVEYGLDLVGMSKDDNYITLGADGTGAIVLEGITVEIKWSYDGTTLSIADLEDDGELPYTLVVFDEDTIALDAETAYFVYVRD